MVGEHRHSTGVHDKSRAVYTTRNIGPDAFALRVVGDSMVNPGEGPSFPEGSLIVVDPHKPPVNGNCVVVGLREGEKPVLKQLVIDGPRRYLKPLNPRYPVLEMSADSRIYGVVVQAVLDVD